MKREFFIKDNENMKGKKKGYCNCHSQQTIFCVFVLTICFTFYFIHLMFLSLFWHGYFGIKLLCNIGACINLQVSPLLETRLLKLLQIRN